MFIAPLVIAVVLFIAFPRLTRFILGLLVFGALFVVASCIDHARAQGMNTEDHETLIRYAGYFSSCAKGNAYNERDKIHELKMLGGNAEATLILVCKPASSGYLYWCQKTGRDEKSCYGDLGFMATDVLRQTGN
jgi:hypothetical protein